MRLAYVCADPGVPVFGRKGASIHVQEVLRALLARGVEVELFASRPGGDPPPGLETVPLYRLPAPPKGDLAAREGKLLAANADLRSALENSGSFDAVYERYSLWSLRHAERVNWNSRSKRAARRGAGRAPGPL